MPKTKLNKHLIKSTGYRKHAAALVIIVIVALIGVLILTSSHASGPYTSVEASSGTLTGLASNGSDPNASDGSYVRLGSPSSPTGTTSGGCTYNNVVAPCIGSSTTGASGWGTPVFDDEFNGTSLDTSNWSTGWFSDGNRFGNDPNNNGCTDSNLVSVSNGELDLQDVNEASSCGAGSYSTAGSIVTTDGLWQYSYGFAEARIYIEGNATETDGTPSFWQDGQDWPTDGELDILEAYQEDGTACAHWHGPPANSTDQSGIATYKSGISGSGCFDNDTSGDNGNGSGQWGGEWHTYAADWEPGIVKFYYDGIYDGCISTGGTGCGAPDSGWESADIVSGPQYLILGIGNGKNIPTEERVDYVRVWQKSD